MYTYAYTIHKCNNKFFQIYDFQNRLFVAKRIHNFLSHFCNPNEQSSNIDSDLRIVSTSKNWLSLDNFKKSNICTQQGSIHKQITHKLTHCTPTLTQSQMSQQFMIFKPICCNNKHFLSYFCKLNEQPSKPLKILFSSMNKFKGAMTKKSRVMSLRGVLFREKKHNQRKWRLENVNIHLQCREWFTRIFLGTDFYAIFEFIRRSKYRDFLLFKISIGSGHGFGLIYGIQGWLSINTWPDFYALDEQQRIAVSMTYIFEVLK